MNKTYLAVGGVGESAYDYAINKNILCFIDYFNNGKYKNMNIPIISYDKFISNYQTKTDLIIQENNQQGHIKNRINFNSRLVKISTPVSIEND